MFRFTLGAAMALALLQPILAIAAEDEAAVVVTATRQARRASELLSDVTIITREEIERAGQTSLPQLLGRQPGMNLATNGGPGASSTLFIRGAEARHTLLLIDGMRVNSATTGQATLENIPLSQIERIEILRGPASVLYGSEALGGVIQIFTRKGEGETKLDAFAGLGRYGTHDVSAGLSGGVQNWNYSLRAGNYKTDGFSATNSKLKQPTLYNPDRDGFDQSNASASLGLRFREKDEIGITVLRSNGKNQYDNGPSTYDAYLDKRLSAYDVHMRNKLTANWTSNLTLGRGSDDSLSHTSTTAVSRFRTDQDQLRWQNDVRLPLGQALLAVERLSQTVDSTTVYKVTKRDTNSLLLGWTAAMAGHRLQINARRDNNSQFGGKTTGVAAYGYQFSPEWRAHASIGTAFNAPTFNQLYFPGFGSAILQPERARNRELGLDWERSAHRFSLTHFDNVVTDLIAGAKVAINIGKARLRGNTLGYAYHDAAWQFDASADSMQVRDGTTGKVLPRRVEDRVNLSLVRRFSGHDIGVEVQGNGAIYDDAANTKRMGGYALLNVFARYSPWRDWSIEARANNIGNRPYETAWGFANPGANLFVGVRYAPK
jgi:vitamin B12 transporter